MRIAPACVWVTKMRTAGAGSCTRPAPLRVGGPPSPSWPRSLRPHDHTVPSESSARVTSLPAAMLVNGTAVGRRMGYGDPLPDLPVSWPRLSRPQPHSRPDSSSASEWFRPAATETMSQTLSVTGVGSCGVMSIGAALPSLPPRAAPQDRTWPSAVIARVWEVPQLTSMSGSPTSGCTVAFFGVGVSVTPICSKSLVPQATVPPWASMSTEKESPDDAARTGPRTPGTWWGASGLVTSDISGRSPHCHTASSVLSATMWVPPGQILRNSAGSVVGGGVWGATGLVRARNGEICSVSFSGSFGMRGMDDVDGWSGLRGPCLSTTPVGVSSIVAMAAMTWSPASNAPSAAAVSGSWATVSRATGASAAREVGSEAPPPMTKHPTEPSAGRPASTSVVATSPRARWDQSARMRSRWPRVMRTFPCPSCVVTPMSVSGTRARSSLARRTSPRREAKSVRLVSARRAAANGGLSCSRKWPNQAMIRLSTSSPPSDRSDRSTTMDGAPETVPRKTVTSMELPPASMTTPVEPGCRPRPPVACSTAATGSGISDGSGSPSDRAAAAIGSRSRGAVPTGTMHAICSGGSASMSCACPSTIDSTGMSNSAGSRSTSAYRNCPDNTAVSAEPANADGSPAPAAIAASPAQAPESSKHTAAGTDGEPSKSTVDLRPSAPPRRAVIVVAPMSSASLCAM